MTVPITLYFYDLAIRMFTLKKTNYGLNIVTRTKAPRADIGIIIINFQFVLGVDGILKGCVIKIYWNIKSLCVSTTRQNQKQSVNKNLVLYVKKIGFKI